MLETLANLYCSASDLRDRLSADGLSLRLGDRLTGTGQYVSATTNASAGATTLRVQALNDPLDAGDTLEFYGANMPGVAEVVLSLSASIGATSLTVNQLPSNVNAGAVAIDTGVNAADLARIGIALNRGTAKVKLFCLPRYDDAALATSWSVNGWATICAAKWLCQRRGNPCPTSLAEDYEEAIDEMKRVSYGALQIEDIGMRTTATPAWSNVHVELGYDYQRLRVETQESESTPTQYAQKISYSEAFCFEI